MLQICQLQFTDVYISEVLVCIYIVNKNALRKRTLVKKLDSWIILMLNICYRVYEVKQLCKSSKGHKMLMLRIYTKWKKINLMHSSTDYWRFSGYIFDIKMFLDILYVVDKSSQSWKKYLLLFKLQYKRKYAKSISKITIIKYSKCTEVLEKIGEMLNCYKISSNVILIVVK